MYVCYSTKKASDEKKLKITIKKPSFKIFDNVLLAVITVNSFSNVEH